MKGKMISNTVQFGFPPGAPRPSWEEIAGFLKHLDSDPANMEAVYRMEADRSLCIKYKTEAAMHEALHRNEQAIKFNYSSGKSVELRMLIAGIDISYVRVFDIPPEVADVDLASALGSFGRIQRLVREKFPAGLGLDHLYTGVRGVYMEINKNIPAALEIAKWKAKVFYDGLKEKCFLCQAEGHQKKSCPQAKKKEQRKTENGSTTYAGVVEDGAAALQNDAEIDGDIIEIVDNETLAREAAERVESASTKLTTESEKDIEKERLKEIDEAAAKLGLENFSANMAAITEMIDALPNSGKDQACIRRAQFAASSSTEVRPKKSARKSTK